MPPARRPSDQLFVVDAADGRGKLDELADRAPEIEKVEPLAGVEETFLVSFRDPQGEPRAAWKRAQELVGEAPAYPVLVDEEGSLHYPTGTLQVRFVEAPSDEELERFAREHQLRLVARNRYQPAQSSFRQLDEGGSYLPDRVRELDGSAGVEAAWEEARASYRRY